MTVIPHVQWFAGANAIPIAPGSQAIPPTAEAARAHPWEGFSSSLVCDWKYAPLSFPHIALAV